jgi:hypothetical protein
MKLWREMAAPDVKSEDYKIEQFHERIKEMLDCKSDTDLALTLQCGRHTISRCRRRWRHVPPEILVRIHEVTDMPTRALKRLLGYKTIKG